MAETGRLSAGNVSDLLLKAMVAVATADGRLDTREVAIIREIYEAREGRRLTAEAISRAQNASAQNASAQNASAKDASARDVMLAQLAAASPELDQDAKEEIIRVAYRVLLADKRISGEERKTLNDIAMALEIPEIHFGAILEVLAVSLENMG